MVRFVQEGRPVESHSGKKHCQMTRLSPTCLPFCQRCFILRNYQQMLPDATTHARVAVSPLDRCELSENTLTHRQVINRIFTIIKSNRNNNWSKIKIIHQILVEQKIAKFNRIDKIARSSREWSQGLMQFTQARDISIIERAGFFHAEWAALNHLRCIMHAPVLIYQQEAFKYHPCISPRLNGRRDKYVYHTGSTSAFIYAHQFVKLLTLLKPSSVELV